MIENFKKWKADLLNNFEIAIYGNDNEGKHAVKFWENVDLVDYKATEEVADVLFSLFTDDEDYEILESVISQLEDTSDKKLFVKCLLKAFPRLTTEAKYWATTFLYIIQKEEILKLIKESRNNTGKQSIIDYINKCIEESKPTPRELSNDNAMKRYLKKLEDFKKLAEEIELSMNK